MSENTKALFTPVDAGHTYELAHHEGDGHETINFIKKEQQGEEGDPLTTVQDGTTNEAVISMLIDRIRFLNDKMPDELNEKAISKLTDAFECLNRRTREREKRGVEGTDKV